MSLLTSKQNKSNMRGNDCRDNGKRTLMTAIMTANHTGKKNNRNITCTRKQQPSVHDRVKLIHVDDEYSGLTPGICGTVSGIYAANEICKSVNRPESIIWVKWDNGIELGLIEGIDKYESC